MTPRRIRRRRTHLFEAVKVSPVRCVSLGEVEVKAKDGFTVGTVRIEEKEEHVPDEPTVRPTVPGLAQGDNAQLREEAQQPATTTEEAVR